MRWIVLVALLFAVEARAQDVGSTMFVASDVDSKRFADADAAGAKFAAGDEVTVLYVEGDLVRINAGDHFGWVAPSALTAVDPNPAPSSLGGAPPREFSMEALQDLLERTKEP